MVSAVVDTNVVVSGLLSYSSQSASAGVMDALRAGSFVLVQSAETLLELRRVLGESLVPEKYGWNENDFDDFCAKLSRLCRVVVHTPSTQTLDLRDITDAKFVSLARAANADYLVTYDARPLLRLKTVGRTRIVTPHKFLLALKNSR
jgi:putative PIN family toxin of toxin-antitoxin system